MYNEINKCGVDATETTFRGCEISWSGLRMEPEKNRAIVDWPRPTDRKEVQQLLGLWNFYRRFIHYFSGIVSPIMDLLRQDRMFFWSEAH